MLLRVNSIRLTTDDWYNIVFIYTMIACIISLDTLLNESTDTLINETNQFTN